MTVPAGTPGDEVPEADWAEQVAEAGPPADSDPLAPGAILAAGSREADEADLAEQDLLVDYGDEEQ